MSKGVHIIAFYVLPDPECSRTTQNSEISLAPSRGHILYAICGNSTCVINHIVITAIDKMFHNYYVSTGGGCRAVVVGWWWVVVSVVAIVVVVVVVVVVDVVVVV